MLFHPPSTSTAIPDNPYPVQLIDGETVNEGRLQIYYNNQWGTVCDDHWTISEATVICHSLGFPGPDPNAFLLTRCVESFICSFDEPFTCAYTTYVCIYMYVYLTKAMKDGLGCVWEFLSNLFRANISS